MTNAGGDEDEVVEAGTEGQGTEGQDTGGGQPQGDLPAELPDEEADDGEQEVEAEPDARPSRGEARIQRLANEAKAAREEAAAARREAEDLRRQQWQGQQRQTEQQEREMFALMTPDERADYRIKQFEQRQQTERQQDRMMTLAMMDKAAFDAKAIIKPVYAKFKDEVEKQFQEQLRQGKPVERETLLRLILGDRSISAAENPKQRRQASERVASQKVASGSGKGDAATQRGKAGDTPADRLKDVFI